MKTRSVVGVVTLALLAAAGAITAVITSDHVTGEAATIALALPTGLAFIGSGIVARTRRPQNGTGDLLMLVGFAWFLAGLPTADEPLIFTLGLALNGLFIGFLAHLLLAFPSGKLAGRTDRILTGAMYGLVSCVPPAILLFDEGRISEGACERGPCPENLLATVPAQPVATGLAIVYGLGAAALSVAVAVRLVQRWRHASPALRSALNPIIATAAVLIAAFAAQIVASFFSSDVARAVNWFVLVAMLAVPLAFLYGLLRPRLTASSRRLAAELAEQRQPEQVRDVLRRALRDPTLELGYRTPTTDSYFDVERRPLQLPAPDSGRLLTSIGDAIIVHDAALADQPELDDVVDAAHIALERGLSMRSLEASERRESALLDAIPDNVYRASADGTFLDAHVKRSDANPDGIVFPAGIPAERLIGRQMDEVLPEFKDVILDGIRQALETDEVVTVEYSVETPYGTRHAEERIVRSGENEAVGISRDVTERKRQEAELEALNRVAVAVATEPRPERLFDIVTEEVGRLLDADAANLVRFDTRNEDEGVVVGKWSEPGVQIAEIGTRIALEGGAVTRVRNSGRPARGDIDDPDNSPALVARLQALGVTSLVAAPIEVSGALWGAVVVSVTGEKSFADDAEARIEQFAGLVAVALANAEARDGLAQLAAEQASLSRVAVAVAEQMSGDALFALVTEEVGRLFGARWSALSRYTENDTGATLVAAWSRVGEYPLPIGSVRPLTGGPLSRVRETRRPVRYDVDEVPPALRARMQDEGQGSGVMAPILVAGRMWGAILIILPEPERFPADAEERLGKFASLVALAIANAEAHEELTASRARIVRAGDEERRRLERNLHDGAQQRLVTLSLALRLAQAKLGGDESEARELLKSASTELMLALEELRELARGLHPAILSDRGLPAALGALAARAPVPVELRAVCEERLPPPVEAAAYYVVAESLTNVAKYAGASAAQVSVTRQDGFAIVEVEDDGIGGADASRGTGLRGLADRVEALEGRLVLASEPGRGTRVRAEIPIVEAG